jgi:hypothetical protein
MIPSLAHLYGEGGMTRFKEVVFAALKIQTITAAIGLGGVLALNASFISLWVPGRQVFAGQAVNVLFAVFCMLSLVSSIPYDVLFSMGHFSRICGIVFTMTAVRIPLMAGFLFIALWGVPLAAVISYVVMAVMLFASLGQRLQLKRADWTSLAFDLTKLMVVPLLLSAAMVWLVGRADNWVILCLQGVGYAGLALLCTVLLDSSLIRLLSREGRGMLAKTRSS